MNDFEGLFPSDYGFKPSNKSAPISGSRSNRPSSNSFSSGAADSDSIFAARSNDFGAKSPDFDLDSVFDNKSVSEPVYDKPVYDDDGAADIFDGVPGIRSSSTASKVKYEDVFSSSSSPLSSKRGGGGGNESAFDDLLGGFGKAEMNPPRWKSAGGGGAKRPERSDKSLASDFDDLLPGFGVSSATTSPPKERSAPEANRAPEIKKTSKVLEDPFLSTGQFSDPLEEINKFSNSRSPKFESVGNGRSFDGVDPFDGLMKTTTSFTSEREIRGKETNHLRTESSASANKNFAARETQEKTSVRSPDSQTERKSPIENDWDSQKTFFDMPTASTDTFKSFGQTTSPPSYASGSFKDSNTQADRSTSSEENMDSPDDIWISVLEVPLFTQPTSAPPPSRPPPPRPVAKTGMSKASSANARRKNNEFSSFPNPSQSFQVPNSSVRSSVVSPIDELEDFVRGKSQDNVDEHVNGLSGEEMEMNSVAAAMKEAMDRAQAKFRQAKEVRERENTKASRGKEGQSERDEKLMQDERAREKQERLERQRIQREKEKEEEEMERLRLEREKEKENAREMEREREREREEREREHRRVEKERERNRQAVERANREARERAALEAKNRAERNKSERAAVDKATSEARERAERAAVQRAQAEARERLAADAKERAERAASEARERVNAESKEREARERAASVRAEAEARTRAAERAAVGRAAAEARERAAADARDRAAANARASQQKNNSEDDIESFFNSRPSSAPRPRTNSSDPFFDTPSQNKSEAPRAQTGNSSNIKKASSATNIVDDLSSIFDAPRSSGGFPDIQGETEERRRARLERHQRTQERAAKALEEKNQRDLQNLREQAERSRIGETLDIEIKRWAAGKEGNLRALLSTMQYVLWPECGWQPVSLTDMITAASVKKVYRKATLCIHPDKVQQKGANLQQKYVAEKVFDLLKEAWNKFNSEELF